MSLMENIESHIKDKNINALRHILFMYGLSLNLLKMKESMETKVYGRDASSNYSEPIKFKGVIINDDFFPADSLYSGTFKSGFLYTEYEDINPGDVVEINRQDGKRRRFKLKEFQSIGSTTEVFKRFEISAMGD